MSVVRTVPMANRGEIGAVATHSGLGLLVVC